MKIRRALHQHLCAILCDNRSKEVATLAKIASEISLAPKWILLILIDA